jgi:hypothetical protein
MTGGCIEWELRNETNNSTSISTSIQYCALHHFATGAGWEIVLYTRRVCFLVN